MKWELLSAGRQNGLGGATSIGLLGMLLGMAILSAPSVVVAAPSDTKALTKPDVASHPDTSVQVPDVDAPVDPRDERAESRLAPQSHGVLRQPPGGTIGGSIWVSQGPSPALFGQCENVSPNNEVDGAVHCLAAHPTDADILYLGAVNGGVWKTTNATAASPTWVPLTDLQLGLSIGAIEFDPMDATFQTLVAGVGRFSSFGRAGPFRTGLLHTIDGGATWTALNGSGVLLDKNISGLVVRGSTIVVSIDVAVIGVPAGTGIFRSVDGGATFTQISTGDGSATGLPGGNSFDLESDPTSLSTLYTNINFSESSGGVNGVYKSTNTGATWTKVSDATMDSFLISGQTSNVEISVGSAGQIYAAILNFGQLTLGGVFRSGNGGATWQMMEDPHTNEGGTDVGVNPSFHPDYGVPGSQGVIHFAIHADPNNSNIVYVGGDRQPAPLPNSIGAQNFSGRLFRGDATQPIGSQWVHLTHSDTLGAVGGGTASSSAPHADCRDMAFDADGNMIEGDDGGIYRRTMPQSNMGDWFSINGNLTVTEFHDIAYDANSNILIGGSQDNGTLLQSASLSMIWHNIRGGDGGDVAIDDTTQPGFSIRYFSSQNLGGFSRFTYDAGNTLVNSAFPTLTLVGGGNPLGGQFSTPIALSAINQAQLVIGGNSSVYESLDQGETIREIGAGIVVTGSTGGNAMAYGGRLPGSLNPHVLYVGSGTNVFRRTTTGSLLQAANPLPNGGLTIRDIVMDPENWNRVYVIADGQVFLSNDGGTSWVEITGNLTSVETFRSAVFITGLGEEALVVGTNIGAYLSLRTAPGVWYEIGTNLPNAPVWDLDYDPVDDVLVAGTLGRGAWTIANARSTLLPDCSSTACMGACCTSSGCTEVVEAACTETWSAGDTCDTACLGSCCDGLTCLDDHTTVSCAALGGTFKLGGVCATSSCSGACCESLTCADNVSESSCTGTWFEAGTCADHCFGACCTGATCTDSITEATCVTGLGGLFFLGEDCGSLFCACVNGAGDCASAHMGPGCDSAECCVAVCNQDAACCTINWTTACATQALALCAENDNCADSFPIAEGITLFDNSLASTDGPPDCLNGDTNVGTKDLWFVHEAACTGMMTVSLCTNTNYDNTLQIYEIASCNPLGMQLGCGDDTCGQGGGPATLTVAVTQGLTYLIRPGGWAGSSGPGEIDLSIAPADTADSDNDGVVNSCDICPGGDDQDDADSDSVPDFCDICPGGDDQADVDGDGVPDFCDICPGGDDNLDSDGDNIPNHCDPCPSEAGLGTWFQTAILVASDGGQNDEFGGSVGVSGGITVAGASGDDSATGAAYVYDFATAQELFKLTATDAAADDLFGGAVAASGNLALIGARQNDDDGDDSGSAYLFNVTTGQQLFKLTASDAAEDEIFGGAVAISGNTAIIGAAGVDSGMTVPGSAYIFNATNGQQLFKLAASDGQAGDHFGAALAVSGNLAVIGAPTDQDGGVDSGSAYIFNTTTGQQLYKLLASDADAGDLFGLAVGISGTVAVVAAPLDDVGGINAGAVYLFDATTGIQLFKLLASDAQPGDILGSSLAVSGRTAIVGAYGDDDQGSVSGSAYLFDVIDGLQLAKFLASDGASPDQFGVSVAIENDRAVVGAWGRDVNTGRTYLFERDCTQCGDGMLDAGEECDPGPPVPGDCCDSACQFESSGFACQADADPCTLDACNATGSCMFSMNASCGPADGCCPSNCNANLDVDCPPVMGNGIIEPGEECDDGNTQNGDGCSSSGQVEDQFVCSGQPSVCSPDCNHNGIADGVDSSSCPGMPWCSDCNANSRIDECDIAPGGGSSDTNANGVPDECDVAPPAAPAPHHRRKNRYISFAPNNPGQLVAFRVNKTSGATGTCWVQAPVQTANPVPGQNDQYTAKCDALPVFRAWNEPVIHVGDCEIIPVQDYEISATADGVVFSAPFAMDTILLPSMNLKLWADNVGSNNGMEWTPPNQFTNVNDILSLQAIISGATIRPTFTVANLQAISSADSCLNAAVNASDILIVVQAIAGASYGPPSTSKITNPSNCPACP